MPADKPKDFSGFSIALHVGNGKVFGHYLTLYKIKQLDIIN
jgi:hypothetical protein